MANRKDPDMLDALRSLGEFIRHHANIGLTKGESGRSSTRAV